MESEKIGGEIQIHILPYPQVISEKKNTTHAYLSSSRLHKVSFGNFGECSCVALQLLKKMGKRDLFLHAFRKLQRPQKSMAISFEFQKVLRPHKNTPHSCTAFAASANFRRFLCYFLRLQRLHKNVVCSHIASGPSGTRSRGPYSHAASGASEKHTGTGPILQHLSDAPEAMQEQNEHSCTTFKRSHKSTEN